MAEIDGRPVDPEKIGTLTTDRWLSDDQRITPRAGRAETRLANALSGPLRQVRNALQTGEVNTEQAEAITSTMTPVLPYIDQETVNEAQRHLIRHSRRFHGRDLRQIGNFLIERLDPDGTDQVLVDRLEREREGPRHSEGSGCGPIITDR